MRAVELNGAAIEMNKQAFAWGRLAVVNPSAVAEAAGVIHNTQTEAERVPHNLQILPPGEWETSEWASPSAPRTPDNEHEVRGLQDANSHDGNVAFLPLDDLRLSRSLDELIQRRSTFLTDYQDAAYAKRYRALVDQVRDAEQLRAPGSTALSEAVARYFFKLMAYKDEYEVARLYTSGEFRKKLEQQFDGDYKLHFHLAPPLLAKKDMQGRLVKQEFGPWMFTAFKWMAKLRFLRGGVFDIFGYSEERKSERQLIGDYEQTIGNLLASLNADNLPLAAEIASIPEHIRGYGHVKETHLHKAKAREAALLAKWNNPREIHVVQAA